jgi:hypothetical protein
MEGRCTEGPCTDSCDARSPWTLSRARAKGPKVRGAWLALGLAVVGCGRDERPRLGGKRVVLELLSSEVEAEVVAQRADAPVERIELDPELFGSDRGLVLLSLPPPAEVRFDLPAAGEDARLLFEFGMLLDEAASVSSKPGDRVHFELELGGESLFADSISVAKKRIAGDRELVRGDADVGEGGELVLRTSFEGEGPAPLVGFNLLEVVVPRDEVRAEASPACPNLIVVRVSAPGGAPLECCGRGNVPTPALDALAARGALFLPTDDGFGSAETAPVDALVELGSLLQDQGVTTGWFSARDRAPFERLDHGFELVWQRPSAEEGELLERFDQVLNEFGDYRYFFCVELEVAPGGSGAFDAAVRRALARVDRDRTVIAITGDAPLILAGGGASGGARPWPSGAELAPTLGEFCGVRGAEPGKHLLAHSKTGERESRSKTGERE